MNIDEARLSADKFGLQCGLPCHSYRRGERIISLRGGKSSTVIGQHGGNIVVEADDGEKLVLAYYEIGIEKLK